MSSPSRYSEEPPNYFKVDTFDTIIYPDQDEIQIPNDFVNEYFEELQSYKSAIMYHCETKKKVKVHISVSTNYTFLTSGRVVCREYDLREPTEVAIMWRPEKNLFRCIVKGRVAPEHDPIVLSSDEEEDQTGATVNSSQGENENLENLIYGKDYEDFGNSEYGWSIISTQSIASGQIPLRVPKHISLRKMGMMQERINLIDASSHCVKHYNCQIISSKNNLAKKRIVGGWFEFIKDHNIQVGDALLFTIWDPPTTLAVKIVRNPQFL